MPKACFLLDHFWGERSGGAEWQTFVLCRALCEAGWEVHYLAESLTGKTGQTTEKEGIVVHWLPALKWRNRFHPAQQRAYRVVSDILDGIKPDVIYSRGNNHFTGVGTCRRYRASRAIRCVWGAAADWEIGTTFYRQKLAYYQKERWKKCLLWIDAYVKDRDHAGEIVNADRIVVQSDTQRQLVRELFQKDAVVLPSSHDVPPYTVAKSDPPTVIFVAHIGRRKRAELFVELARRCNDLNARFLVVGDFTDATYEHEVRNKAVGLGTVEFLGPKPIEETNRLIGEASLLVSTTDPGREGYPNVFMQAWLRETPVASLAFDPDGVIAANGFLGVRADSMENLVNEVRLLLSDNASLAQMGQSARAWAQQRHGYEANKTAIVRIFTELAQQAIL